MRGGVGGRDGRTGLTLVDVGGGQGAGSPVLSQAPPPPIPSGQIKNLVQSLCAQRQSKLGSRRGWAPSGEDRIRTGPLPPHQRAASEPATCPPTPAAPLGPVRSMPC